MSSSPSRERQLATARDVLAGRAWKRAWRAVSYREKWRIVRAVHRGRAVEREDHAWLTARVAADALRRRGLNRRVILLAVLGMTFNLVGQLISGRWVLASAGAAILLAGVGVNLFVVGNPKQLAAAEAANRTLSERIGGPL